MNQNFVCKNCEHFSDIIILISCRCDVNTCDDEGWTPLRVAAMFNQPAILKALIASHMIKDKSNNTVIDYRGTC